MLRDQPLISTDLLLCKYNTIVNTIISHLYCVHCAVWDQTLRLGQYNPNYPLHVILATLQKLSKNVDVCGSVTVCGPKQPQDRTNLVVSHRYLLMYTPKIICNISYRHHFCKISEMTWPGFIVFCATKRRRNIIYGYFQGYGVRVCT